MINLFLDKALVPNYSITLAEVVEALGEPDFVTASRVTPEIVDCSLAAIWLDHQMVVSHYEKKTLFGKDICEQFEQAGNRLPADLIVQEVEYKPPEYFKVVRNHYVGWSGFAKP